MVSNLGHVGLVCDDFFKMRDFYTRVIGLTVTDEDPDRGSCFLSADPDNEHHELALGEARGDDHPMGRRPKTTGVGHPGAVPRCQTAGVTVLDTRGYTPGNHEDQKGLWEADRLYLDYVGKDTFYGLLAS